MIENTKADGARLIYANSFGFAVNVADIQVILGVELMPGTANSSMEVQSTLAMSHVGAKWLANILNLLIDNIETQSGQIIPFDDDKFSNLKNNVELQSNVRSGPPIKRGRKINK